MKILERLSVLRRSSPETRYRRFASRCYPSCEVCASEAIALCEALEKLTRQPVELSTVDESIFEISGGRDAIRKGADSLDQVELVAALEEEFGWENRASISRGARPIGSPLYLGTRHDLGTVLSVSRTRTYSA